MKIRDPFDGWDKPARNQDRSRALLMAKFTRVPIWLAIVQMLVASVVIPVALGLELLAAMGVAILLSLIAALRSIDRSLGAFAAASQAVYFTSLLTLCYAVLVLRLPGSVTVYSTASIVLGSAYLLGTRSALFWTAPWLILAGLDVWLVPSTEYSIPPAATLLVRALTLGTILGFVICFRRAHDRQVAELQLLARTDPLTGLANRLAFDDALIQALGRASRFERSGALVFADLDGMKTVNDNFGHEAGDAFLKEVGDRVRAVTRAVDTAARLGGDEFVVLISVRAPERPRNHGKAAIGRHCEALELSGPRDSTGRKYRNRRILGRGQRPHRSNAGRGRSHVCGQAFKYNRNLHESKRCDRRSRIGSRSAYPARIRFG